MSDTGKDETTETPNPFMPSPDDIQHWTSVMGRAQQMMLEYALGQANEGNSAAAGMFDPASWLQNPTTQLWAEQSSKLWEQGVAFWTSLATIQPSFTPDADARPDKRFADPDWPANPVFALFRPTYGQLAKQLPPTHRTTPGPDNKEPPNKAFKQKKKN